MGVDNKVPEIRFSGFYDEWQQAKLGDISEITIGEFVIKTKQNDFAQYPVYNGGVSYTGFYNEYNNEGEKVVISARGANAGYVNYVPRRFWAGNSCYSVDISGSKFFDKMYIYYFVKTNQSLFTENQQSANIPSVSKSDVSKFIIVHPSIPEQSKIGNYFKELDELIRLQEQKHEKLLNLKKAMLDKMFPKEGADVPEIRFKGFTDKWEKKLIGEVCSISTGKSNTQDKKIAGAYPFYVRSATIEKSSRYLYDEEAVLTVGDGVGTGKVYHYVNGKYDLHQRVYRMFDFSGILGKYFYYIFSREFYKRVMSMTAKTSVDSVRLEMISEMSIKYPAITEQSKIVSYLDNLENLIAQSQEQITKYKNIKQALLQKMFV